LINALFQLIVDSSKSLSVYIAYTPRSRVSFNEVGERAQRNPKQTHNYAQGAVCDTFIPSLAFLIRSLYVCHRADRPLHPTTWLCFCKHFFFDPCIYECAHVCAHYYITHWFFHLNVWDPYELSHSKLLSKYCNSNNFGSVLVTIVSGIFCASKHFNIMI
jgi:hypothetical protein